MGNPHHVVKNGRTQKPEEGTTVQWIRKNQKADQEIRGRRECSRIENKELEKSSSGQRQETKIPLWLTVGLST